jgi:FkbM family methyltransferase
MAVFLKFLTGCVIMSSIESTLRSLKRLRRFINSAANVDVVKFDGHHNLRSHLSQVFSQYGVTMVLDVGANEGQFAQFLREIGYEGDVHSFEPVKRVFDVLSSKARSDSRWHVHHCALGAEPGFSEINVSDGTVLSSMLPLSDYARQNWERSKVQYRERIEIKTIDQCVDEGILPERPFFLKMDTQGFDLEVFRGARRRAASIQALLSELSFISLYDGAPDYSQSLSVYEAAGFRLSAMYPVTRNSDLTVNEMDCIMVKVAGQ